MARPRIIRAPEVRQDLIAIWAYIADRSAPSIADTYLARIYGAIELLASEPHIGKPRPEFPGAPRSKAVRSHTIFYTPLPEGDGIYLWRIIHGRRDLPKLVWPRR